MSLSRLLSETMRRVQFLRAKGILLKNNDVDLIGPIDGQVYLMSLLNIKTNIRKHRKNEILMYKVDNIIRNTSVCMRGSEVDSETFSDGESGNVGSQKVYYKAVESSGLDYYVVRYENGRLRRQVRVFRII